MSRIHDGDNSGEAYWKQAGVGEKIWKFFENILTYLDFACAEVEIFLDTVDFDNILTILQYVLIGLIVLAAVIYTTRFIWRKINGGGGIIWSGIKKKAGGFGFGGHTRRRSSLRIENT